MTPSRIEIEIAELVLVGFERRDRHAIAEAIERELADRLTADGLPPAWAAAADGAVLNGGTLRLPECARSGETGAAIARHAFAGGE